MKRPQRKIDVNVFAHITFSRNTNMSQNMTMSTSINVSMSIANECLEKILGEFLCAYNLFIASMSPSMTMSTNITGDMNMNMHLGTQTNFNMNNFARINFYAFLNRGQSMLMSMNIYEHVSEIDEIYNIKTNLEE